MLCETDITDSHTSGEILAAIYNDIPLARPAEVPAFLSTYANMKLNVHSDFTSTSSGYQRDESEEKAPYFIRLDQGQPDDEYRRANVNGWVSALIWDSSQTKMLKLEDAARALIEDTKTSAEFLGVLAHERQQSTNRENESHLSHFIQTGDDALFRLTTHKASNFVSRSQLGEQENALHVACLWDLSKQKWLLLGLFLGAEDISIRSHWHNTVPEALSSYQSAQQVHADEEGEDEDDDYWAQYDDMPGSDEDPEDANAPDETSGTHSAQKNTTIGDSDEDDDYYKAYDEVEPMIHGDDVDRSQSSADAPHSVDTAPKPRQSEVSQSKAKPSHSTSKLGSESISREDSQVDQDTENEAVLKTHVQETVRSLYKLAKLQGVSPEKFIAWTLQEVR